MQLIPLVYDLLSTSMRLDWRIMTKFYYYNGYYQSKAEKSCNGLFNSKSTSNSKSIISIKIVIKLK